MASAQVSCGYASFLSQLVLKIPTEVLLGVLTFGADVVRGRNRIAARILREPHLSSITHVLWLDDDQFPEDIADGVKVVQEMMELKDDQGESLGIVGAPYTNKKIPAKWVYQPINPEPSIKNNLLEVRGVGFGFTMTSRRCLESLAETAKWYQDDDGNRVPNIFGMLYDKLHADSDIEYLLGEDYSFCKRWRDNSGRIYWYMNSGIILHAGWHPFGPKMNPT